MAVIKLIIPPAIKPGSIRGSVILRKTLEGGTPRLIAASSTDGLIVRSVAEVERVVRLAGVDYVRDDAEEEAGRRSRRSLKKVATKAWRTPGLIQSRLDPRGFLVRLEDKLWTEGRPMTSAEKYHKQIAKNIPKTSPKP